MILELVLSQTNFREGWSIAEVSVMSGHKSIAMVQRYTRIKAEDLVKKMEVKRSRKSLSIRT